MGILKKKQMKDMTLEDLKSPVIERHYFVEESLKNEVIETREQNDKLRRHNASLKWLEALNNQDK